MKHLIIAASILAALCAPAAAQDIGGNYAVNGTNFDGSAYSGTANIKLTSTTTCVITWTTGGSSSDGICMRNENAFAAAYVLNGETGLVVYEIKPNGEMDGLWTLAGQDGNGTEVLTPTK